MTDVDDTVGGIERASIAVGRNDAVVTLSFGPEATIEPTEDQTGVEFRLLSSPHGGAIVSLRITFGPDLKPKIEHLQVTT